MHRSGIKKQVWSLDSQIPVSDIQSMDDLMTVSVAQERFNMLLLGIFAVLAMTLAGVGIYGMIAYRVNQRTHDIGVYIALGAQHRDVLRLIMKDGIKLTMVGIVLGLLGAVALTRLMVSLLFEVTPTDPATLIAVALLLLLLLLAATALGVLHSGTPSIEHSTRNRPAVRITTFARFVSSRQSGS